MDVLMNCGNGKNPAGLALGGRYDLLVDRALRLVDNGFPVSRWIVHLPFGWPQFWDGQEWQKERNKMTLFALPVAFQRGFGPQLKTFPKQMRRLSDSAPVLAYLGAAHNRPLEEGLHPFFGDDTETFIQNCNQYMEPLLEAEIREVAVDNMGNVGDYPESRIHQNSLKWFLQLPLKTYIEATASLTSRALHAHRAMITQRMFQKRHLQSNNRFPTWGEDWYLHDECVVIWKHVDYGKMHDYTNMGLTNAVLFNLAEQMVN